MFSLKSETKFLANHLLLNVLNESYESEARTFGGISSDTCTGWHATGDTLSVKNLRSGQTISSWRFGRVLQDLTTTITCIVELPAAKPRLPLLIIALNSSINGGSICIFDSAVSRVIRAIEIGRGAIMSMTVVNGGQETFWPGALSSYDGILALGFAGGDVFLVDLCRPTLFEAMDIFRCKSVKDEVKPSRLKVLRPTDLDRLDNQKQIANNLDNHLAIHLNYGPAKNVEVFSFLGPSGSIVARANKDEVLVTCIYYSDPLCSLIVGYNFGAFQIWNLLDMTVVYTSPIHPDSIPITHLTLMEPTEDPRPTCYLWAVYSCDDIRGDNGYPDATMYRLSYDSKEHHEGHGHIYEGFKGCNKDFQTTLASIESISTKENTASKYAGGQCIHLSSWTRNESNSSKTIVICQIAWIVYCPETDHYQTNLGLFDLNQWYQAQMPGKPTLELSFSYIIQNCLSDFVSNDSPMLDVRIEKKSVYQFFGRQRLEEHYYPNALSFDCIALNVTKAFHLQFCGIQRQILSDLWSLGPIALLKPDEFYEKCVRAGLVPLCTQLPTSPKLRHARVAALSGRKISPIKNLKETNESQREYILNVAVENCLHGLLRKCADSWAVGSCLAAGCSLHWLVDWAWRRANVIQAHVEGLCEPLFNFSGQTLDANSQATMKNCIQQLNHLRTFFDYVIVKCPDHFPRLEVLQKQANALRGYHARLEVISWMHNFDLLPEHSIEQSLRYGSALIPYSIENIAEFVKQRRSQLSHGNQSESLLFIDWLLDMECGAEKLKTEWKRCGHDGLYPPMSLQLLLRVYLVEDIDIIHQHMIVTYFLYDVVKYLDPSSRNRNYILNFPTVFKIPSSIVKIMQAFWEVDHGELGTGVELLIDPAVSQQHLTIWQHRLLVRALYAQEKYGFALLYLSIRNPELNTLQDTYVLVSLYVRNDNFNEAFKVVENFANSIDNKKILKHLYQELHSRSQLERLTGRKLTDLEERVLFEFMSEVRYCDKELFFTIYYIQNGRYIDLARLHPDSKELHKSGPSGLRGQAEVSAAKTLASEVFRKMTRVEWEVIEAADRFEKLPSKIVSNLPVSAIVNRSVSPGKLKPSFVEVCVAKAMEVRNMGHVTQDAERKMIRLGTNSADVPFLGPPNFGIPEKNYIKKVELPRSRRGPDSPPPSKKRRITPTDSELDISEYSVQFNTPIVNRIRSSNTNQDGAMGAIVCVPSSILKGNFNTTDEVFEDDADTADKKISPRKPLDSSDATPHSVRFINVSNSLSEASTVDRNCSTDVNDSVFNSTDESNLKKSNTEEHPEPCTSKIITDIHELVTLEDIENSVIDSPSKLTSRPKSPQRRRGIKDKILEPTRSSPRIRRSIEREFTPDLSTHISKTRGSSRLEPGELLNISVESVTNTISVDNSTTAIHSSDGLTEIFNKKTTQDTKVVIQTDSDGTVATRVNTTLRHSSQTILEISDSSEIEDQTEVDPSVQIVDSDRDIPSIRTNVHADDCEEGDRRSESSTGVSINIYNDLPEFTNDNVATDTSVVDTSSEHSNISNVCQVIEITSSDSEQTINGDCVSTASSVSATSTLSEKQQSLSRSPMATAAMDSDEDSVASSTTTSRNSLLESNAGESRVDISDEESSSHGAALLVGFTDVDANNYEDTRSGASSHIVDSCAATSESGKSNLDETGTTQQDIEQKTIEITTEQTLTEMVTTFQDVLVEHENETSIKQTEISTRDISDTEVIEDVENVTINSFVKKSDAIVDDETSTDDTKNTDATEIKEHVETASVCVLGIDPLDNSDCDTSLAYVSILPDKFDSSILEEEYEQSTFAMQENEFQQMFSGSNDLEKDSANSGDVKTLTANVMQNKKTDLLLHEDKMDEKQIVYSDPFDDSDMECSKAHITIPTDKLDDSRDMSDFDTSGVKMMFDSSPCGTGISVTPRKSLKRTASDSGIRAPSKSVIDVLPAAPRILARRLRSVSTDAPVITPRRSGRITRKRSGSSASDTTDSNYSPAVPELTVTPRRRSMRTRSVDMPLTSSMLEEDDDKTSLEPTSTVTARIRTRRSMSVDTKPESVAAMPSTSRPDYEEKLAIIDHELSSPTSGIRTRRAKSVEPESAKNISARKAKILAPIVEESKEIAANASSELTTAESLAERRRMTRNQKTFLQSKKSAQLLVRIPVSDQIDPIALLDKPAFEGNPDPDEDMPSGGPASPTSSLNSAGSLRSRRGASVDPQQPRPRGRPRKTRSVSDAALPTIRKSSSRNKLEAESRKLSNASSLTTTAVKKSATTLKADPENLRRSTRNRTQSMSSSTSDVNTSSCSAKLSKIPE